MRDRDDRGTAPAAVTLLVDVLANDSDVDDATLTVGSLGVCDAARVSLTVTIPAGNRAPLAVDDALDASDGALHRIDVLANDSDPDGDPLRVASVSQGSQGSATIGGDGQVVYAPVEGALGGDVLTYSACDRWNVCDEAQVIITLAAPDTSDWSVTGGACANGGTATLAGLMLGLGLLVALRRRRSAARG